MSDQVNEFEMTALQFARPKKGDNFRLYRYGADGFHSGGQWFTSGRIRWADEQITAELAKELAEQTIKRGHEIRVTDAGDMLVFHSLNGKQLYPAADVDFWSLV